MIEEQCGATIKETRESIEQRIKSLTREQLEAQLLQLELEKEESTDEDEEAAKKSDAKVVISGWDGNDKEEKKDDEKKNDKKGEKDKKNKKKNGKKGKPAAATNGWENNVANNTGESKQVPVTGW